MCEGLAEGTLADYHERARWILREVGENTPISKITFDFLDRLIYRCKGVLRNVTLKKRIDFLIWCLRLAEKRGLIDRVPEYPKLRNDSEVRSGLHTVAQVTAFRSYVPPGRFRKIYLLGFWTLQHMPDVMSMERWMLDPDRIVTDEAGKEISRGAFWRRNQKYRRCVPEWIPMQPELREATPELLDEVGPAKEALLAGRVWNLKRTWDMAADRATADGHEIPRVTPTDLRRGGASMLTGRGYSVEAVRIVLGHAAGGGAIMGGPSSRPSTATRHYLFSTPGLFDPSPPSTPSGT